MKRKRKRMKMMMTRSIDAGGVGEKEGGRRGRDEQMT